MKSWKEPARPRHGSQGRIQVARGLGSSKGQRQESIREIQRTEGSGQSLACEVGGQRGNEWG